MSTACPLLLRSLPICCPFFEGDGAIIFKQACSLGCEGIVSKRLGSSYRSGRVN
jgi:ATP-dependent DNA ligase